MRFSCLYHPTPITFRRSSKKIYDRWGTNLQNVEKGMREIYIPDGFSEDLKNKCLYWLETGDTSIFSEEELERLRVFGQRDQSGAEALIVAYDCDAGDYREIFKNNISPHVYVGMKLFPDIWKEEIGKDGGVKFDFDEMYNCKIAELKMNPNWKELSRIIKSSDDWPTERRYYYFAKQTGHSGNYGIEWATFQMNVLEKSGGKIMIPSDQCKEFLMGYRGLFPEIPRRNDRVRETVQTTGMLFNMLGFPFIIPNYKNIPDSKMKEFYAWGMQSTVGEITRIAICETQEYIESNNKKWDILQDNHDSFLTQFPLTDVKEYLQVTEKALGQQLTSPIDGTVFNMRSEYGIGFNWSPYKKGKNDLGLRGDLKWLN